MIQVRRGLGGRVLASVLLAGFSATTVGVLGVAPAAAEVVDPEPEVAAETQTGEWPEASLGDENLDVFAAKHQLHYLGYELENLDSAFDESVHEQVVAFQEDEGLTEDEPGVLGQETWEWLTARAYQGGEHYWSSGDRGHMVMMIQRLLNAKYQAHIAVDGEYGPETETAVGGVQEFHEIEVSGNFDIDTFTAVVQYQDFDT